MEMNANVRTYEQNGKTAGEEDYEIEATQIKAVGES